MADSGNPTDRQYTAEHAWVQLLAESEVRVGITSFAQEQLGDIVYVELPAVGDRVTAGEAFGIVESVKTASDLYAPVDGVVLSVNEQLSDEPQRVNDDPYGEGWLLTVKVDDASQLQTLLSEADYAEETGD